MTTATPRPAPVWLRFLAAAMVATTLIYLLNNYLTFWRDWPGARAVFGDGGAGPLGWAQLALYLAGLALALAYALRSPAGLRADADRYTRLAAYIARAAFWAVLLVGLADAVISFLRVEGHLGRLFGPELEAALGRSSYRGTYVHYPLIGAALVIALFSRSLGFIWLALLVVAAEFQIVISRFVFSYEQAFMGDLVRFWYAALFLFASAYTLLHEGHVRVDVLYTMFSKRGKAWANAVGSLLFGLPLCWTILIQGMWGKADTINSPLLNFEISQSGYGMYTKYLMAGFLVIFAVTMIVQFVSVLLHSIADLRGDPDPREPEPVVVH